MLPLNDRDPFANFDRNFRRTSRAAVFLTIVWILICLAVFAGIIFVALHFAAKYW
jgi:hypothetical protein